jgi:hypothetical protein
MLDRREHLKCDSRRMAVKVASDWIYYSKMAVGCQFIAVGLKVEGRS